MTKRLSSKLLSVILALAICATTVFGCLMTVSANTSWLSFSAGESTDDKLTKASINLTVNLGDFDGFTSVENDITYGGMMLGEVALSYDSALTLTGVSVDTINSEKVNDDYTPDAGEFEGFGFLEVNEDKKGFSFMASNSDDVYYEKLIFKLNFELASPAQDGDKFIVTATSAKISGGFGEIEVLHEENNVVKDTIVMGCDHALTPVGDAIITDTVNGYAVYSDSVCTGTGKCGKNFGKQVVPTKLPGVIEKLVYDYTQPEDGDRYYDSHLADSEAETGESWETAIIIDSALELSYLTRKAGDETKGKYYKVADGISGFDMATNSQGQSVIDFDGTLDENFDAITTSGKRHDAGETYFQGHFDGNGATVYGLWTKYNEAEGIAQKAAGLFAYAKGNVTIKNINVSLSYFKAKSHAGGIVGAYSYDTAIGANDGNKLTIECCSVTDCHIEITTADNASYANGGGMVAATGAIYGAARCYSGDWNGVVKVSNCFINLDEAHFVSLGETDATANSIHGGIGGVAVSQKATFDNCVVIGVAPYSVFNTEYTPPANVGNAHQHTFVRGRFSNIYTTAAVTGVTSGGVSDNCKTQDYTGLMYQISANQIKGADAATNMPTLFDDPTDVWEIDVNRGYPKFKQAETPKLVNDTSDFELKLIGTNITYNNGGDYNYNFYYRPNTTETGNNYEPVLYVAQLNKDGKTLGSFHRLTGTPLSADAAAAVGSELQEGDIRYTIERLSAREIYNTLLATAIDIDGNGKAVWGDTNDFSIAETEQKIIDGNYDTADKNLAEAVLKYGRASEAALNTKNDAKAGTTIYWDGTTVTQPTQTDGNGNTLITSAAELAYITSNAVTGKYKVADGISNIVLQKEEHDNGIMQLSSQSDVEDYFENSANSKTYWLNNYDYNNPTAKAFNGSFDGNGATIYGLYGSSGNNSLFGAVGSTAVIKNLAVKNCYLSGSNHGAVVSARVVDSAGITYSNIEISNCRMEVTNAGNNNVGLLVGTIGSNANVTINNLLVYGCEIYATNDSKVHTCLSGYTTTNNAATGIKNSVILDCSVTRRSNLDANYNFSFSNHVVENVYSSYTEDNVNSKIKIIDREDAMGMAAVTKLPNLDWTGTWCYGTTYPSLAKGAYTSASSGKILYWDNKTDSNLTDGDSNQTGEDADHAIIIDSAEELAYLVRDTSIRDYAASVVTVEDKYYKIADGIDAIVLQPQEYVEEIMALDSAAEVKDYFSDPNKTFLEWAGCEGWETGSFAGTFDGNGVTIYGLYGANADGGGNKGLFATVDAGATFRNFTIKNAYLHTTKANFNVGAIACVSCDGSYGDIGDGFVWADRCAVVNSYIRNDCDSWMRSGIMFGTLKGNKGEAAYFDNCLVYGNDAAYGQNDTPMAILGSAKNDISDETAAKIPNGLEPVKASDGLYRSMVRNSVIIGATPYIVAAESYRVNDKDSFVNVYTDAETQNVVRGDGSTVTYDKGQITQITDLSQLVGNNASDIVSTLNAGNGGKTVWYPGKGTILGFNPTTEMIASAQAVYDAITFETADDYGNNDNTFGVCATSLNLKTNPYISFAFAFSGKYKSNRDKIKVTFEYTVDGTPTTKEVWVANESGALLDGWSNPSNDRYHTYRFEDIPVVALSSPITVTVAYNGEEKVTTGTFSVEGFGLERVNAYKQTPCKYYETRIEAVKALLFYTQMLQARYGTQA